MDLARLTSLATRFDGPAKEEFCQDYIGARCVPDSWETLEYCCVTLDCKFNKPLNGYFCECNKHYKPSEDPNAVDACYYAFNDDYVVYITVGVLLMFFLCVGLVSFQRIRAYRRALAQAAGEQRGEETAAPASAPQLLFQNESTVSGIGFESFGTGHQPRANPAFQSDDVDDKPPSYESVVVNQKEVDETRFETS